MNIKGKMDKSVLHCDVCIEGKFVQTRNREPDARAKLVHTDLAGLDTAQYGRVKQIRSDNALEFMGNNYQALLSKNGIKHERSAPYSPHQNGTAERNWRTLVDMARCMLIESQVPKELWTYAVQTAFVVRNRCFNNRTKQAPYFMLTGRRPNLARMQKFGSVCYAYRQNRQKLDSKGNRGIFVGYDKNSPAYLVYYPSSAKVQKHRLIKCVTPTAAEQETQTEMPTDDDFEVLRRVNMTRQTNPLLLIGQT